MNPTKPIGLSLLIALELAAGVSPGPFRTDINPALLYYQAFLVAPHPLSDADSDYLGSKEGRGQRLPERFGDIVAGCDGQFQLVRQAARAAVPCDWGIDMSDGPHTLLPHLARAKAVAVAARLRVRWELEQGRQAEARDDLLAAFALARNVARDGTLIAALVQIASEAINLSIVAENFRRFSPETLQQVADGIEAAPTRRTTAACVAMEKSSFHDWLRRRIVDLQERNAGNEEVVMAGVRELLTGVESDGEEPADPARAGIWEKVNRASGGTSAGVLRLMDEREASYQRLAVLLALPRPEFEAQVKESTGEAESAPNPVISLPLRAFERCRRKEFKIQVWLAMVRAAVEYKLHGTSGLQAVTDPCGQGPFGFRRFVFQGVDRGFELRSAYDGSGFPEVLIFVEKEGPPFRVDGPHAGEAVP